MGTFDEKHYLVFFDNGEGSVNISSISSDSSDGVYYARWNPLIFGTDFCQVVYWDGSSYGPPLDVADRIITFSSIGITVPLTGTYNSGAPNWMNLELQLNDDARTAIAGYTFGAPYSSESIIPIPSPNPSFTAEFSAGRLYNYIENGTETFEGRAYLPAGFTKTIDFTSASGAVDLYLNGRFWFYNDTDSYVSRDDPFDPDQGLVQEDGRIYLSAIYLFGPTEIPPLRLIQRDDNRGRRPTPRLIKVTNKNGSSSAQANDLRLSNNNRYDAGFGAPPPVG